MKEILSQALRDASMVFDCESPKYIHYKNDPEYYGDKILWKEGTLYRVAINKEEPMISVSSNGVRFVDLSPEDIRWLFLEASARGWYDA